MLVAHSLSRPSRRLGMRRFLYSLFRLPLAHPEGQKERGEEGEGIAHTVVGQDRTGYGIGIGVGIWHICGWKCSF
jgi:hypothetical protein